MNSARYWIWLQQALGDGVIFKPIIEEFGGAEGLYNANIMEWRMSSTLSPRQVYRLEKTDIADADKVIETCEKNSWKVISYDHPDYPQRLREIINPPAVLYVDGEMPDIDNTVVIGIVGTRRASEYAVKVCEIMSKGIAECSALVVSGGALGIDSAAHSAAMAAGGKTVAVLGCGLGANYLMQNKNLRERIKRNGALITEFPPFTPAAKHTFPLRNRIISGLSLGVLVVEAGVKSGSLITAKYALEQGRDVFAVPGSVLAQDFAGTNKLIDDGAYVVTQPVQLLSNYSERFNLDLSKVKSVSALMKELADPAANVSHREDIYSFDRLEEGRAARMKREQNITGLSNEEKNVYDILPDTFTHIDILAQNSSLSQGQLLAALTKLELLDLAESASGGRFKRK